MKYHIKNKAFEIFLELIKLDLPEPSVVQCSIILTILNFNNDYRGNGNLFYTENGIIEISSADLPEIFYNSDGFLELFLNGRDESADIKNLLVETYYMDIDIYKLFLLELQPYIINQKLTKLKII